MSKIQHLSPGQDIDQYNNVLEFINTLKRHVSETARIFPFIDYQLCLHRAEQYLALGYAALYEERGFLLIDPEFKGNESGIRP